MTEDKTTLTAAEVDAELETLSGWSRDGISQLLVCEQRS